MLKKTHRLGAAVVWVAVAPTDPLPLLAGAAIAYAVGGGQLSPDMDLNLRLEHRGPTHYIEVPLFIGALAFAFALCGISGGWALAAFAVGWGTHLVMDVFSGARGVPSLIFRERLKVTAWMWIHTGGWFEHTVVQPALAGLLVVVAIAKALMMSGGWSWS